IAGIGEDGAAAEGARAELHAALEPAEDLALGKELRRGGSGIREPRRANLVGLESGFDGVVIKRGTEIRVAHGLDGEALAAIEIGGESSAEGHAIIGSGGLNEKIIDNAGGKDFAVGFRIESHPPGKTQIAA